LLSACRWSIVARIPNETHSARLRLEIDGVLVAESEFDGYLH
jgi:hypothetical protein